MSSPPSALSPPVELHLEDAVVEHEDRDVERAAAEVVDRERAVLLAVEAVRERRRGRLVEQAQHVEPGEPPGVLRGLALRVVEVRRHGDHGAADRAELVLGALLERAQDLGADLDRRDHALACDLERARPAPSLGREAVRAEARASRGRRRRGP